MSQFLDFECKPKERLFEIILIKEQVKYPSLQAHQPYVLVTEICHKP